MQVKFFIPKQVILLIVCVGIFVVGVWFGFRDGRARGVRATRLEMRSQIDSLNNCLSELRDSLNESNTLHIESYSALN